MSFWIDLGVQWVSYIVIAGLTIFFLNWVSNGFLVPSIRVKLSKKKTFVIVHSLNGQYYKIGMISGGFLIYTDNEKNTHRVPVDDASYVGYIGGTKSIHVDEQTDKVLKPDLTSGRGFDGVKFENLYTRALQSPTAQDKSIKIILIAAVVAAIAAVVALWLIYLQGQDIAEIRRIVEVVREIA